MGGEVTTKRRKEGEREAEPVLFGPSHEEARHLRREAGERREADLTAASVILGGDTSQNRHGEPVREFTPEVARELAAILGELASGMGLSEINKGLLARNLTLVKSPEDVLKALEEYFSTPTVLELMAKASARLGVRYATHTLERLVTPAAVLTVAITYSRFSMEHIIGPENEEGRQQAQLNRYAAAWAGRLLDDDYSPDKLPELDQQTERMNRCSHLGIEDALKTITKLGGDLETTRKGLIAHYGTLRTARENLTLELLRQAGVIR